MDLLSSEGAGGGSNAVVIVDIPAELDQEDLELYLTSQRLGGGDIDDIQLDALNGTALVKFTAADGMTSVISKIYVVYHIYVHRNYSRERVHRPHH